MFSLTKHIKSYFAETSLHGFKYITEEGRVTLERLLWIILVFSGMVLAVIFMLPGITYRVEHSHWSGGSRSCSHWSRAS